MAKSIFTSQHRAFIGVLRDIRRSSSVTQKELSSRLEKDQSYISNIERAQRRLDVIEFMAIAAALGRDATELFGEIVSKMGEESTIRKG
ncbi:MAG: helix-turn-helix transcriptional regulator [Novosphingobium sp.]|nr:helix-turn-helix transcriptional regulator [Novosphingobium sp.]